MKNHLRTKFLLVLSAFLVFSLHSSLAQTWTKINGTFTNVHKIYCPSFNPAEVIVTANPAPINYFQDKINFPAVADSAGMFISSDSGKTWSSRLLSKYLALEVIRLQDTNILIAGRTNYFGLGAITFSYDAGKNWTDSFDLKCNGSNMPYCIRQNPFNKTQFLVANVHTAEGITKTLDTFATCELSIDQSLSSRCISFSNIKEGLVFSASEKEAGRGVYKSIDGGAHWTHSDVGISNLRILSVYASSINPALVFCSADTVYYDTLANSFSYGKGIYRSIDTGATWTQMGLNNLRITEIIEHPFNKNILAAAADSDGVFLSGTFGWSWEQFNSGLPANSAVHTVAFPAYDYNADGSILYAGTDGGVYISSRIKTGVDDKEANLGFAVKSIYPNPCNNGNLTFELISENSQVINIELIDAIGASRYSKSTAMNGGDIQQFNISDLNTLASGVYFLKITSPSGTITKSVSILN